MTRTAQIIVCIDTTRATDEKVTERRVRVLDPNTLMVLGYAEKSEGATEQDAVLAAVRDFYARGGRRGTP